MKKIAYKFLILLSIVSFYNCDHDSIVPELEYVTFSKSSYSTGVDPGGSTSFDITVYASNISSSDRSFNVSVDASSNAAAGSYTVPSSVTIPAGSNEGALTVALTDTNLGIGVNNLVINFESSADYFSGASTTLSYIQNCTEVTATLDIIFDGYGSEVTWDITDSLGGVVVSGGGYADGQATASESITLCAGRDYTFTIYDSFGDGLSFPANGTYTLTLGGSVKASGGGNYGASESTAFDTN
ncbi:hypothetical protein L3X39_10980 [Sabulilitoribacter multivorans]|uniref:Calx-beta domain-containing protein n=1 Tax=Flaviramulus multivorans TaxID=1304750 RepID=A0ABS9IKQ1_9FLAO|nr:hypothetical protein [Flaviramulus multivorans]MCF7561161.1 hypothetical protein [Flaviramulus multivorans]